MGADAGRKLSALGKGNHLSFVQPGLGLLARHTYWYSTYTSF